MSTALEHYKDLSCYSEEPYIRAGVGVKEYVPHHETGTPTLTFKVCLRINEEDVGDSQEGITFLSGLIMWADTWRTAPEVELLFMLPEDYPSSPPEVRLLRPILKARTGGVQNGFFLGLPELYPAGWFPGTPLPDVLALIRGCLVGKSAEVEEATNAFYTLDAYASTRARIINPPIVDLAHRSHFTHRFTVVSSTFARSVMFADIPPGFEAGGKVLLPMSALELVMRRELRDGLDAGGAQGAGFLGAAISSGVMSFGDHTPRGPALDTMLSVGQGDSMTGESAMVFSLTGPAGFPVFVGVREFTCPDPSVIIVPPEVLANLGVPEGSTITVTNVDLPQVTSMTLQPHTADFLDVEDFTGLPPREFLEQSLSKFSAIQAGQSILVDGDMVGCREFRFSVVALAPRWAYPAGALFAGFASQISIEFLPAVDTIVSPLSPGRSGGVSGGGTSPSPSREGGGGGAASFQHSSVGFSSQGFHGTSSSSSSSSSSSPSPPPQSQAVVVVVVVGRLQTLLPPQLTEFLLAPLRMILRLN